MARHIYDTGSIIVFDRSSDTLFWEDKYHCVCENLHDGWHIQGKSRSTENNDALFGKGKEAPIINYRKAWGKIRDEADLNDFRFHDLRHNFASAAINVRTSLTVVGALLEPKISKLRHEQTQKSTSSNIGLKKLPP